MPLYKSAQNYAAVAPISSVEPEDLIVVMPQAEDAMIEDLDDSDVVVMPEETQEIMLDAPQEMELSFKLPALPGADDQDIEVVSEDDDLDEEGDEEEEKSSKSEKESKKDWQSLPKGEFLSWFKEYLDKLPRHNGETLALERAFSYLKRGLDTLSKAVQSDYDGEIDISKADDARSHIEDGMSRLERELERRKKKAMADRGMTKEAQQAPRIGGIMVTVPLAVSAIARACVNAVITNGKDLNDTFNKLAEKYSLTDREKMETIQLLKDMNMPIKRDLNTLDDNEYGYSSENNMTLAPNYYS